MIDYSHLFQTRDPKVIADTIAQMDTASLMQLQNKAEENLSTNSSMARWPLLGRMVLDTGFAAAIIAASQPIAKWQGWTNNKFLQYMKHPAALGALALTAAVSIFTHRETLADANSVDIARLAEREMNKRLGCTGAAQSINFLKTAQHPETTHQQMQAEAPAVNPIPETAKPSPSLMEAMPTMAANENTPAPQVTQIAEHNKAAQNQVG